MNIIYLSDKYMSLPSLHETISRGILKTVMIVPQSKIDCSVAVAFLRMSHYQLSFQWLKICDESSDIINRFDKIVHTTHAFMIPKVIFTVLSRQLEIAQIPNNQLVLT